jgi:hypothetical protein
VLGGKVCTFHNVKAKETNGPTKDRIRGALVDGRERKWHRAKVTRKRRKILVTMGFVGPKEDGTNYVN